ncbi:hypothetical protein H6P81_010625 [Aristolochia fimbriata]|uniref:Uncharacterized protein n=1 Tax=Aristolochia fimbriata TaxID=158543 RepID=A0AAV7EPA1_ARIFI|nr:hypothetical protein H6P81_010625 [Aristolochia fimbriata]
MEGLCGNLDISRICPWILGAKASEREATSLSELLTLSEASLVHPRGRLDLPLRGEPTRDPGTSFAYSTWWKDHMSPQFVANKKRAPLTTLNGASASKKKARVEAQPASFPLPPTFLPPISETEPPQTSCPPMEPPEPKPPMETVVETVQISSSLEADPPASIQTFLLGASDVQEEVLPPQTEVVVVASVDIEVAEAPVATAFMGPVLEVAPALTQLEALPPLPAPPTPAAIATPLVTSSQQLQSDFRGMVLQFWKDRIAPRMLSSDVLYDSSLTSDAEFVNGKLQEAGHDMTRLQDYTQKLQALTEEESLAREKTSRISKDSAESDAREALDMLSSKLDNAKVTLDKAVEDLSQAKLDEEDARERLELAREQAQSAETKVVYLATQVEQIRESVRELKEVVLEARQKVEEVIALPTLNPFEEPNLLSLRAAFVGSQQELAKDL